MNKDRFIDLHRNMVIQQQEIERKWRVYLWEQEELARMQEAQMRSIASGVDGGLTQSAESTQDYMDDNYMIDAANYVQ
jgi:hypothetical protein